MDTAWNLAQDLVRIDSSDPGAYEGRIEQHISINLVLVPIVMQILPE